MEPDLSEAQVLFRSVTEIVVRWRNAVVQYRNGALNGEVLAAAEVATPSDDGGPVALLSVLGPRAVTPGLLIRLRQRRVLRETLQRIDGYSAVVLQNGVHSADGLLLSSRLVTQASSRMRQLPTVSAATCWLGERSKREHELESLWNHIVGPEASMCQML